ncbi:MAG: hypothetical protein VST67_15305, partial [Nitrospirota bacterium]|nr:hypothetical protein [Nitrospirota bacterium]
MKGYRPIYICVGFSFIANMTGCVTTPSVWQKTQEFNRLAVYQDSLLKTPLRESAYVPKRRLNQFTLRKVAKQNQMLEGRRQLGRANQEKIIHLKHYTVNSLTEDQFLADGWDLCNSYRLALGIVGRLSFDISGHSAIRAEYSANLVAS